MSDYKMLIAEIEAWQKDAENYELVPPNVFRKCKFVIEQLAKERDELVGKINKLERELNAAIADLEAFSDCTQCKYYKGSSVCEDCYDYNKWEWRGVQDE